MKKKVCMIMGGVMPVPAVCGGAIETLVNSIVRQYSKDDDFELTICSVYHSEAVKEAEKYPDVRFFWTHTNSFWNLCKHSLFLIIRQLTGKNIRVFQRHYNEIAHLFEKEHFDLIIAEGGDTQAIVDITKGYTRDQFVNHIHIHYLPPANIVRNYGHMIGVSEFVTREYMKVCNVPVKPHVLKNAIDIKKFNKPVSVDEKNKIRNRLGLSEDDFVILFVGRIIQVKGILELMHAITGINNEKVKLLVVGSANFGKWEFSPYANKVKKFYQKHQDQIIFTGYVDNSEVYQYASVADIQCVPSLWEEAAGLVVLEAMAEGLPLIITISGGMIEYIDKSASLIIDRKNIVEKLKESIIYMKEHPEVRKQMSENSRNKSIQYDEPMYYRNFVKVIHEMAGE